MKKNKRIMPDWIAAVGCERPYFVRVIDKYTREEVGKGQNIQLANQRDGYYIHYIPAVFENGEVTPSRNEIVNMDIVIQRFEKDVGEWVDCITEEII